MPGTSRLADLGGVGRGRCGIPSTSTRAITPRTEGKPGIVAGGQGRLCRRLYGASFAAVLPSVRGVIGLRQVDGMPHRARSLRDDQAMVPQVQIRYRPLPIDNDTH